jgi:sulfonate transport system ATP-binding protein
MTPRPGTIRAVVESQLPRPRDRTSSAFLELRKSVLEHLTADSGAVSPTPKERVSLAVAI